MTEMLRFWKSSYSAQGQACVEVAHIPSDFRKSSHSGQGVNCVEVANLAHGAALRDSKHPTKGHLAFPSGEWAAFLTATQGGQL
ncbi:DUF397 domain-containing protein [Nocardiopsis gilva YIM 90087]|uniref:DUF397 domain-containing protein n=1 Tax=Nocardiopsis gilva YIM 90087 TaxID=1235441 RepID=A0A223S4I6_9ACTN|nr:DUF397 domain-containing protein [Nocardiopsis gilva]ASU82939.1 DUF397 domain-containing protein [Nocardiopsis gilva YIM 90087]